MLIFALARDVDTRAAEILRGLEDVRIIDDSPQTVLISEESALPVRISLVEAEEVASQIEVKHDDDELLVVNAVLDEDDAAVLEDMNAAYIDAAGRRWLRSWERTKRVREMAAGGGRRLYAASIRLTQLLADHPREP